MANVPSPPILVTLMMEEIRSSETSVVTTATLRHIPEDAILHHLAASVSAVSAGSIIIYCLKSVFKM
jgi:hypothetical protein